jgi:signal transduction histidine kinase
VWAWIDPPRVEQVLVNLLENAIKYTVDDRPIEVDVRALSDPETRRPTAVRLAVHDHGLPIPPDEREHVFERFQQVGGSRYTGGMGLGLYVSRRIVEAHDGSMVVEAAEEGGNRFVVSLPSG